jgi:hypothetical protein
MRKTFLVVLIALAVVVIVGSGIVLAYMAGYEKGTEVPQPSILETSKVIQVRRATAIGEVVKIEGRTVTLTTEGDTLEIPMEENAEINAVDMSDATQPTVKIIKLEDVKIGDNAAVQLEITSDNEFGGSSLIVNP